MAYNIDYGAAHQPEEQRRRRRKAFLTAVFFGLFLWSVFRFWPEGRELLKTALLPGDPEAALEAVQVFAQELGCGFSLGAAAENFWNSLCFHGYPG